MGMNVDKRCIFPRLLISVFPRFSSIKVSDVKFFPSYVSILLESSKTDQLRQGAWIVIARFGQPTCPVKALEHYIAAGKKI